MKNNTLSDYLKEQLDIEIKVEPEDEHPRGYFDSGDEEADKALVEKILEESKWNEWAWCMVTVKVSLHGKVLGRECLGGCSYESQSDFIQNSGYYEDMVDSAMREAVDELVVLASGIIEWGG